MSSPIALQELFKAGFDDFAIPVYENAPFTTIQNRAQVTRSLKAIAGVERIHVRSVNLLQKEFGANGERIWEADNKDPRIRFTGTWSSASTSSGSYVTTTTTGDVVSVVFYGTGLNLLHNVNTTTADFKVSVDGGAFGSNIFLSTYSGILDARNYNSNTVLPVISGLTLGWHNVRIRLDAANIRIYGFEILNQRSDLAVYSGAGVSKGITIGLSSLTTSNFSTGISGTRGARVVKYIQNGSISQAVQEVNATAAYSTSADHTNEEIIRRINYREFGANRADDFSTLAGTPGARAFTLDDGTTTLVGDSVVSVVAGVSSVTEALVQNGVNNFITLTFVGTGLDIIVSNIGTASDTNTFIIDGVSVATGIVGTGGPRTVKVCSGLPYGTHVVRFVRTSAAGNGLYISDFVIYQPKKPSIPNGAFEVADCNVMANYSLTPATSSQIVSTGVLRKQPVRERVYAGAWSLILDVNHPSGHSAWTTTAGNYLEYTFFGTGVEIKGLLSNAIAINRTYSINGSTNLTAYTIGVSGATGLTFTAATGVLSGTPTTSSHYGETIFIRDLPLGRHTLRCTFNSGYTFYNDSFDIITPIHINSPSLKIGSQSLNSVTKYSPEKSVSNTGPDLSKAKAWVVYDGISQAVLASHNVSAVLKRTTGAYVVIFEKPFKRNFSGIVNSGSGFGRATGAFGLSNDLSFIKNATEMLTYNVGTTPTDAVSCGVWFGELIDE